MAHFRYECFCTLVYDSELTYEEVLEREATLEARMMEILESCGGKHIDFVPDSDSLQIQCAFADWQPEDFRLLCAETADLTVSGVRGRLLVVSKDLDEISIALLAEGSPVLARVPLPEPGGADRKKPGAIALAAEPVQPMSDEERHELLNARHSPAPEPEVTASVREGQGADGGGAWPAGWVTPSQLAGLTMRPEGEALPDASALLDAWRDLMRRRLK